MSLDGYETGGFHDPALRGRIWRLWSRALREVKGKHADRSEWALLHALMRRAHLFIAPTEMADARDDREYTCDFVENFVLPFPVVAATLEDDASVNLLAKMPDDWLELKDGKVGYLTASISEARAMASVGNSSPGLTGNWLIFCLTPARPMNESDPPAAPDPDGFSASLAETEAEGVESPIELWHDRGPGQRGTSCCTR